MKTIEMRQWVPEAINTPEENEILIRGAAKELLLEDPGQNTILIGGDTLVFAAKEGNGDIAVYECTIRRASVNVVEDIVPDGCVGTRNTACGLLS